MFMYPIWQPIFDRTPAHVNTSTHDDVTAQPVYGDHLVTPRQLYSHHGIFLGGNGDDAKVIHYSGLANGLSPTDGKVEIVSLTTFCNGNGFKVRPHVHAAFSRDGIVKRAMARLGEARYNFATNNCEHLVYSAIYDRNVSPQVRRAVMIADVLTRSTPVMLGIEMLVLEKRWRERHIGFMAA